MPIDYANLVFNVKKDQAQAQISQLNTALDKTKKTSDALKLSLGSLASVFSFAALAKTAYQYSGALKQIQTNFTQVFAGAKTAKDGLARLKNEFQMTEMQAMQSLNSIAMRLRNLVPRDALAQTSTDLTALSENLAVQFAENADKIRDSLVRALQGQTRGLRDLGINISVDSKELKAAAESLQKSAGYTEQQARSMAILNEILKQTGQSSEAFAKNANNIKTQVDNITNTLKEQIAKIVKQLDPLIAPVLKILNYFLGTKIARNLIAITAIVTVIKSISSVISLIGNKFFNINSNIKTANENQKAMLILIDNMNAKLEITKQQYNDLIAELEQAKFVMSQAKLDKTGFFSSEIPQINENIDKIDNKMNAVFEKESQIVKDTANGVAKFRTNLNGAELATNTIRGNITKTAYAWNMITRALGQIKNGDFAGLASTLANFTLVFPKLGATITSFSDVLKKSLTSLPGFLKEFSTALKVAFTSIYSLLALGIGLLIDVVYTGFKDGWDAEELHFTSMIQNKIGDMIAKIFLGIEKMKIVGEVLDSANAMITATKKLKSSIAGFKDIALDLTEGVSANENWSKDFSNLSVLFNNAIQTAEEARELGNFIKNLPGKAKEADWKGTTYTMEELKAKAKETTDAAADWAEQLNEAAKTLNGKYREQTNRLNTLTKDLEAFRMSLMTRQEKLATINSKLKELQKGPQTFAAMEQQVKLLEQRRQLENEVAENAKKMNESLFETLKNISTLNANYTDAIVKTSMKAYETINRAASPMIDVSKIQNQIKMQDNKTVNAIVDLKKAMISTVEKSVKGFEKGIEKIIKNNQGQLTVVSAF